jgi:hypothetical protein
MGNKFGLIDLNENELKEFNGGMFQSIISLFLTSGGKVLELIEGIKDGYERAIKI